MLQKSFKGTEKGVKRLSKLPDTIHTGIEVLWRQKLMCDIELITPDRKHFKAHKIVLATCCDYFYDIFAETEYNKGRTTYVEVQELSGNVLEVILEAMYTGKVKIEATNVDDILQAASTLGVFVIMEACEEFLMEYISKENCLQLLGTAFKYNLIRLTDSALEIAAKNFQAISRKPLFRNLPVEHLIPMLKRNDLEVENELEVFQRMCMWIEESKQNRLQHAANVMSTVRLPLLDPTTIVDSVESCSYLMDIPECENLVKEALHYHCMPSRQCLLQVSSLRPYLEPFHLVCFYLSVCVIVRLSVSLYFSNHLFVECAMIIERRIQRGSVEPLTEHPLTQNFISLEILGKFDKLGIPYLS